MLWNWYTIDACFLSSTWHVQSAGGFAGSCIGAIFLVIALELLRRVQRETDRAFHRADARRAAALGATASASSRRLAGDASSGSDVGKGGAGAECGAADCRAGPATGVMGWQSSGPRLWQQVVRSLLYMLQFAVGYFVMLLAMYYNGELRMSDPNAPMA